MHVYQTNKQKINYVTIGWDNDNVAYLVSSHHPNQRSRANCNEFRINPKITIFIKDNLFKMPLTICRLYYLSLNAQIQLNSLRQRQNNWHFADEILLKFIVGCSVDSKPGSNTLSTKICIHMQMQSNRNLCLPPALKSICYHFHPIKLRNCSQSQWMFSSC